MTKIPSGDAHVAPRSGDDTPDRGELLTRLTTMVTAELERASATPPPPGLYLVATPIGNLADITLRALTLLAAADTIYCEDTRHSRTLLAHFGIRASLQPYHEHNAEAQRPRVLQALEQSRVVALISDAGTPLVSDPGFKLVRDCLRAGYHVESLPGPCAAIAALTSAGLPTDAFYFAGFLPSKPAARQRRIAELGDIPSTLLFYEAPQRLSEALGDLAAGLGPRPAAIARELTKRHEEFIRGTLAELAEHALREPARGEIVLVVGPPAVAIVDDATIEAALATALQGMSLRDAARTVANSLSVPRQRVYEIGLALKRTTEE